MALESKKVVWEELSTELGSKWKLKSFNEQSPQTWKSYLENQIEYWDADNPSSERFQYYFGDKGGYEGFLKYEREQYSRYVECHKEWHSLCRVGELVDISIRCCHLYLSRNWTGKLKANNSDLDIVLQSVGESCLFGFGRYEHHYYACDIFQYGTIVADERDYAIASITGRSVSPESIMTHELKTLGKLYWNPRARIMKIDDAAFQVVV
ncbi:hypothetical protein [Pseudodesulfovibrio methanolicus]|uniref:Uncharacterized protein n=1 Tax=Pseudodesulfovibrio methanolicus TaxID=3126690 RepID=A0ABZ2IUJ0_9BACT